LGVYPVAPEHPSVAQTLDALFFVVHLLAVVVEDSLKIALLCEQMSAIQNFVAKKFEVLYSLKQLGQQSPGAVIGFLHFVSGHCTGRHCTTPFCGIGHT